MSTTRRTVAFTQFSPFSANRRVLIVNPSLSEEAVLSDQFAILVHLPPDSPTHSGTFHYIPAAT